MDAAQIECELPDFDESRIQVFDAGDSILDRYTVVYMDAPVPRKSGLFEGVGMNARPFHPLGFGQHEECAPGEHLGKKISFAELPKDCRKLVLRDLRDLQGSSSQSEAPRPR